MSTWSRSTRRLPRRCSPGRGSTAPTWKGSTSTVGRSRSGHPLGASGTRLLTTLVCELERSGGRYGLQTMCEGGGMANATLIERLVTRNAVVVPAITAGQRCQGGIKLQRCRSPQGLGIIGRVSAVIIAVSVGSVVWVLAGLLMRSCCGRSASECCGRYHAHPRRRPRRRTPQGERQVSVRRLRGGTEVDVGARRRSAAPKHCLEEMVRVAPLYD